MKKPNSPRFLLPLFVTGLFAAGTGTLSGAGFALQEQSISGLGVGFAAGASGGEDNSSMFFNPASLTLFEETQVTTGIHFILPEAEFRNEGSLTAFNPETGTGVPTQGADDTADVTGVVPNLFFSMPAGDDLVWGVGISVPFGLATSYEKDWVGRYVAVETDLATINSNFAAGYRISDTLSVGGGVNVLYGDAILSNAINFGLAFLGGLQDGSIPANEQTLALQEDVQANLGTTKYDGFLSLEGDDYGFGFNLGVLWEPTKSTRIGAHYRSSVDLTLSGDADFETGALEGIFGSLFVDQGGKVDLELPDSVQVSLHQRINENWAVMADAFYTWWSKFDELVIEYETGFPEDSVIPENWEDVWRFSVGTTYEMTENVQLRFGFVYDESPVPSDRFRSPRIPDNDRYWLTTGIGWQVSETVRLDLSYAHIIVDDPGIDNPTHTSGELLRGTIDAKVNIVSLGLQAAF